MDEPADTPSLNTPTLNMQRFEGARLQAAAFPDDTGEPGAEVAAALAAYASGTGDHAAVVTALRTARLLVPVVALLGEVEYDDRGLAHDKSSDMAAVLLTGADGRMALLAFTGTDAMAAWNPEARPVAVPAPVAASAAVQERAAALVVDVAGPVPFVVEGPRLLALARVQR